MLQVFTKAKMTKDCLPVSVAEDNEHPVSTFLFDHDNDNDIKYNSLVSEVGSNLATPTNVATKLQCQPLKQSHEECNDHKNYQTNLFYRSAGYTSNNHDTMQCSL